MSLIHDFLDKNRIKKIKAHCIGDAMIDEYFDVFVNRISPEFPMPVMLSPNDHCTQRPGGVANVAYQLRHYNVDSRLICFADVAATSVFRSHRLGYHPCTNASVQIPRKKRFLDHGIQVKRWDVEAKHYGLHEQDCCKARQDSVVMTDDLEFPDVAILSDYNKGFFGVSSRREWMHRYRKKTITVVDPKVDVAGWEGCTVFKPNAKEAEILTGCKDWKRQCDRLREMLLCQAVVITQGGDGVVGWDSDYFEYRSQHSMRPESVIGAGDCFIAHLAMSLAHEFTVAQAAEIAFTAGTIYVQHRMNRPVVPAELCLDKIVVADDLLNRDFKLVMTNGCFDMGLTSAHVRYLQKAKLMGDKLLVAVNGDDSVRKLKGEGRPVVPLTERMEIVAGLECVDFVSSFDEDTPLQFINKCKPDLLVKGGDYKKEDVVGYGVVDIVIVDKFNTISTTEKIERMKANVLEIPGQDA